MMSVTRRVHRFLLPRDYGRNYGHHSFDNHPMGPQFWGGKEGFIVALDRDLFSTSVRGHHGML